MNEDEKINKNIIKLMFCGCLILLASLATAIIFYSPKTFSPSFTENQESESAYTENIVFDDIENNGIFPIKINTATSEELQLIPNVGPSTAKLIIDYRNEHGTIVTFTELLSIDGIGKKTVEVLKEYCIIN